ncbi:MAG: alanyl-tRNA editing protein [Clostridia bacterium]|nr:alanyl-tRNA editing protein [Clostridia bacterium]
MINLTKKLYDENAYRVSFSGTVLACEEGEGGYRVVLDQTVFFPEEGGQKADKGSLGGIAVSDVKIKNGVIYHIMERPLTPGEAVDGKIDFTDRFRKMQNHSAEHIVSGLVYRLYGFHNVGFHLGDDTVTLDFDGVLERPDLTRLEQEANRAVFDNLTVKAEYPPPEVLSSLSYRSKLDLKENVRIVTIPGIDVCACCAPHVSRTGEIGLIKLTDYMHYKGGVRITLHAGWDAYRDYSEKYLSVLSVANLLSAKQEEVFYAVTNKTNALNQALAELKQVKKALIRKETETIQPSDGVLCLFVDENDRDLLRERANMALERQKDTVLVVGSNSATGKPYFLVSAKRPLRQYISAIQTALGGKGGGKDDMVQGSLTASPEEIVSFFSSL